MTSFVPTHRTRVIRLTTGGIVLGAAVALAVPLAASAHVHVTPDAANASASTRLAFSFSHGCEDSPTTSLIVTIPDGVDGVTPVFDGGWTVTRELGDDGIPTEVTYTAVNPVEDGLSASVAMDVIFATSAANSDVAFPVVQVCETGQTDWVEVAADGQSADDLEAPAPVVAVGDVVETDGHGHSEDASDDHTDDSDHAEAADDTDAGDPVARWLSAGALVAALAALGVAFIRRRRA